MELYPGYLQDHFNIHKLRGIKKNRDDPIYAT
ncbi:hypothetical protein BDA96_07G064200 [Sorghum bicolor]|uniref:Uncharacterized protein n=1 Tax=Sorghum bicolor TaxID=4558 RepID=A0A921U9L4_SORBI|nr:hypothetical protein BDA96_07G064200 [Sorghum bicolor]